MNLKQLFSNTWMDNPLFHVQAAHALAAAFTIMVCALFWKMTGIYFALGVGVPIIAFKEFWYDLKYELPNDTWQGSALDFGCYMIGATVAVGLIVIKFYALKN